MILSIIPNPSTDGERELVIIYFFYIVFNSNFVMLNYAVVCSKKTVDN